MNKKVLIPLAVFILAVVVGAGYMYLKGSGSPVVLATQTGNVVIKMGADSYSPEQIKIKKGTTITFQNVDTSARWPASDLHPSHLIYPEFDPRRPIAAGESWQFTFEKVGEWGIHDHLSPYITGKIIVVD